MGPLYTECARRGELMVAGQRTTDIPALLEAALARWGTPVAVVSDRFRIVELRPHLEAVHFPKTTQLVERGMGYRGRQGLPAGGDGWTRDAGQVSAAAVEHGGGAGTVSDPSGNAKLAKGGEGGRRERARDDAVAAAILAVSVGQRGRAKTNGAGPTHAVVG